MTIEKAIAGCLFKYCVERAMHLDVCDKVSTDKRGNLVALSGTVKTLAKYAVDLSDDAGKELGIAPEQYELDARSYLAGLAK